MEELLPATGSGLGMGARSLRSAHSVADALVMADLSMSRACAFLGLNPTACALEEQLGEVVRRAPVKSAHLTGAGASSGQSESSTAEKGTAATTPPSTRTWNS